MSDRNRRRTLHARHTTGVPGLDTVLQGGLIPAAVYIVQGSPGAGKTILANQMCFHKAAQGEHCLYVTLLAESHDRMIDHLKSLSFFDEAQVPQSIYYESAFGMLEREGLNGVLRLLTQERKARHASLIVLDGLFVLEESGSSEAEFRRFVNDLSTFAHMSGTTILLLTNSARSPRSPEYTMVDGWLELGTEQVEYQSFRYLQVHKFRGSAFLSGQHMTTISDQGLRVFPRLETSLGRSRKSVTNRRLLTTGISAFDQMLGGGLRNGSAALMVGPTGIGKTIFGLEFIGECTPEEPGLILGFYENDDDLIEKAHSLGIALEALIHAGTVEVLWKPSTENGLDEIGYELIEAVRRRRVKRLFVDGVNALRQSAVHAQRIGRFLAALTNALRSEDVTSMYTLETEELVGGETKIEFGAISAVSQNIVLLRYVELENQTRRTLAIVKVRSNRFSPDIREFEVTEDGIHIGERFQRVDDVLMGHAHPRTPEA